jgi:hypothetical protein
MFNSKKIGNRIGAGTWSSYCAKNSKSQTNNCYNLSGSIMSSSPLLVNNIKLNSKFYTKKNINN